MAEAKLVRKLSNGKIEARKRGRAPIGAINGYLDSDGSFVEGNPRKARKGKRGRPKGSVNKPKTMGKPATRTGGLSEIELIIKREVATRLIEAKKAAIEAFTRVIGV
jgi:hypothetical protein